MTEEEGHQSLGSVRYWQHGKPLLVHAFFFQFHLALSLLRCSSESAAVFEEIWKGEGSAVLAQKKTRHPIPCVLNKTPHNRLPERLPRLPKLAFRHRFSSPASQGLFLLLMSGEQ